MEGVKAMVIKKTEIIISKAKLQNTKILLKDK
jgi:hypothetical protein